MATSLWHISTLIAIVKKHSEVLFVVCAMLRSVGGGQENKELCATPCNPLAKTILPTVLEKEMGKDYLGAHFS